jgi:hypothetical protein
MKVSVENTLAGIFTGVKNGPVARKSTLGCDLICGQEKRGRNRRAVSSNSSSVLCVQSWNQKNMSWRLRV